MISAPFRQFCEQTRRVVKHREENGPQPHAVGSGADPHGDQRRKLQPAQRRDHAEGKKRGERQEREEHIRHAARDARAQPTPQGAQRVEHQRERRAEKECSQQRPRLIGDGQAHPKSRAKKPPPDAGSSA